MPMPESEINSNVVGSENHEASLADTSIESDLTVDFNDLDKLNGERAEENHRVINGHANMFNVTDRPTINKTSEELLEVIKGPDLANRLNDDSQVFAIFVKKPSSTTESASSTENVTNDTVRPTTLRQTTPSSTTVVNPIKLIIPTRETLQQYGFTSGHQNNFGIPIEEDERILTLLNAELVKSQNGSTSLFSTTDSSVYRTRVSPTLPIISRFDHTTEGVKTNGSDDGK